MRASRVSGVRSYPAAPLHRQLPRKGTVGAAPGNNGRGTLFWSAMRMHERTEHGGRATLWLLAAIVLVLAGWALHMAAAVAVPMVTAVFVVLVVAPADSWLRARLPKRLKWLGHVAALLLILAVLAVFVAGISLAAQQVLARFPELSEQVGEAVGSLTGSGSDSGASQGQDAPASDTSERRPDAGAEDGGLLPQGFQALVGAGSTLGREITDYAAGIAGRVLDSTTAVVSAVVLILFLSLLMLVEAPRWRAKLGTLAGDRRAEWEEVAGVIAAKLRQYLLIRTALGIATAALYAGWLMLFGIDLIVVWALLAVLLNFIPTVGSLIAGVLPVLYALVQVGPGTAALVALGLLVIEQVMGNYVDPMVQGRRVAISPTVILVVLLVWGWIWGLAGAILAVPMTVAAVVIFAHVRPLRPLALLLSDRTDMEELDRAVG